MNANGIANLVMALPVAGAAAAGTPAATIGAQISGEEVDGSGKAFNAALAAELLIQALGADLPAQAALPLADGATLQAQSVGQLVDAIVPQTLTGPGQAAGAPQTAAATVLTNASKVVPQQGASGQQVATAAATAGEPPQAAAESGGLYVPGTDVAVPQAMTDQSAIYITRQPQQAAAAMGGQTAPSDVAELGVDAQASIGAPLTASSAAEATGQATTSSVQAQAGQATSPPLSHPAGGSQQAVLTIQQNATTSIATPAQDAQAQAGASVVAQAAALIVAAGPVLPAGTQQAPPDARAQTKTKSSAGAKGLAAYQAAPAPQNASYAPAAPAAPVATGRAGRALVPPAATGASQIAGIDGAAASNLQTSALSAPPAVTAPQAQSSAPAAGADASGSPPLADQVANAQTWSRLQQGNSVTINLDPPELGHIRLHVRQDVGGIRGVVEVDNAQTLAQLQREAPALTARLADGGVSLRRMDLVLAQPLPTGQGQGLGGGLDHQGQSQGNFNASQQQQQQPSGQGRSGGQEAAASAEQVAALSPAIWSDGSDGVVNVWI